MSTLLIARANRVFLFSMAAILVASLLAPLAAFAGSDLIAGDSAVINNSDGSGANLRSSTTSVDDSTIIATLDQGTTVFISGGPFYVDTGVWFEVTTNNYGLGFVSSNLLQKVSGVEEADVAPAAPEQPEQVSSGLAWIEPIDSLVVVDYDAARSEKGLEVRTAADLDAPIVGHAAVGSSLQVTNVREWVGEVPFVRVNFNGEGAYVDGRFVELASEAVVEEPEDEIIWIEEEPVVEVPVEDQAVVEAPVEETDAIVAPLEDEAVAEIPAEDANEADIPTGDEAVSEIPAQDANEADVSTEDEAVVATPDEDAVDASTPTGDVAVTEAPAEDRSDAVPPTEDEDVSGATDDVANDIGTPAEDEAVTKESDEAEADAARQQIATTADTFDSTAMIGSAAVTGTTSGLLCRTAPQADAPVLMTLPEGTKVLVSAEAVNGYLGIDCGGLQGFGDVNYLWSGGAGDAEVNGSKMNVAVTGTGNGLNCRTGAGLNHSVITTVYDGTILVTRGAASNGWAPVVCGGQNGFVSTTWIEVKAGSSNGSTPGNGTASGTATINTGGDGLYCRSGAGSSYGIITVLRHGSSVAVRGAKQGDWIPVTCGGAAGFAHASYLNVSSSGTPSTPTTPPTTPTPKPPTTPTDPAPTGSVTVANTGGQSLNCRSGAGISHGVITSLSLGQSVKTRSGSVSGWTAVICGGANGFVSSDFVTGGSGSGTTTPNPPTPTPPTTPSGLVSGNHAKATSSLNMRYNASISSGVSTTVPAGTVMLVTGSLSSDFYPVDYDGITGFMHGDYLVKTNDALSKRGGSGTPTTPPPTTPGTGTPTGNALVNYAMRYVGYPYVWATHGPASFDCSGFTYWVVLNVAGKNIGAGTWTQVGAGTPVSRSNLQPGDLVFFQNTYTAGLSHVGMYIGNNQFIHAENETTGVVISDLNSSYYGPRWYSAVRM